MVTCHLLSVATSLALLSLVVSSCLFLPIVVTCGTCCQLVVTMSLVVVVVGGVLFTEYYLLPVLLTFSHVM